MAADGQEPSRRKPIVTPAPVGAHGSECEASEPAAKPTAAGLGVDLAVLDWQRSGTGTGSFEVAFVAAMTSPDPGGAPAEASHDHVDWVLLRVTDDPSGRVLVYDRNEWMCFLDGAWHGEFDRPEGLAHASVA